ncbi:MAG: putative transporter [Bacteroidetes bacterium]|nr:putative transporter [Bacteroidota bacterium]
MKNITYIFIFLLTVDSFGQENLNDTLSNSKELNGMLKEVEISAKYPGGVQELVSFIQKNLKYPKNVAALRIGGKAVVKFIVDFDGKVCDAVIVKTSNIQELDNEALRVVSMMGKWEPATIGSRKVKCYFNLPVTFSLEEPYFVFTNTNKNKNYFELCSAIITNDLHAIWNKIKEVGDSETDPDYLFLKGVLYYHNSKHKNGCQVFEKIIASGELNSESYRLSEKYIQKYCS